MDLYNSLFGKKTEPVVSIETNKKNTEILSSLIQSEIKKCELNITKLHNSAMEFISQGNKTDARDCLNQKQMYIEQLRGLKRRALNLLGHKALLSDVQLNTQMKNLYKKSNIAVKDMLGDVDDDEIHEILDEMDDVKILSNQLTENFTSIPSGYDNNSVDKELELMENSIKSNTNKVKEHKEQKKHFDLLNQLETVQLPPKTNTNKSHVTNNYTDDDTFYRLMADLDLK